MSEPTTYDAQVEAAEGRWTASYRSGPKNVRWGELPVQPGDAAPDVELPDHARAPRSLASFWAERPALILFWRHFGCSCGMDRAGRLRDEMAAYRDAGAEVVIVGQGESERASAYRDRQGLDCPILCDTDYRAYEAYGILEGTPSQVLFDAPDEFLRLDVDAGAQLAESRRGTERTLVDNPWLLPGEFVVGTDGVIHLAHRWQYCEDYPDPRVHVSAIKEARGETWAPDGAS